MDVGEAVLRVRHGGSGPAVLLLHGHPRTHTTWDRVTPLLAETHTVVCPDLRGYGESSKPETTAGHEPYSKRAMARDCVSLLRSLGHRRFAVVGHDRGAYVALRCALDYRAGLGIDRAHDDADRAADKRAQCPVLALWATRDDMEELYGDPLEVWRTWTDDLRGGPIESGHPIAEEAPEALVARLSPFLDAASAPTRDVSLTVPGTRKNARTHSGRGLVRSR